MATTAAMTSPIKSEMTEAEADALMFFSRLSLMSSTSSSDTSEGRLTPARARQRAKPIKDYIYIYNNYNHLCPNPWMLGG